MPITTFTVILYSKCIVPVHLVDMIILPCCVDSINVYIHTQSMVVADKVLCSR